MTRPFMTDPVLVDSLHGPAEVLSRVEFVWYESGVEYTETLPLEGVSSLVLP